MKVKIIKKYKCAGSRSQVWWNYFIDEEFKVIQSSYSEEQYCIDPSEFERIYKRMPDYRKRKLRDFVVDDDYCEITEPIKVRSIRQIRKL